MVNGLNSDRDNFSCHDKKLENNKVEKIENDSINSVKSKINEKENEEKELSQEEVLALEIHQDMWQSLVNVLYKVSTLSSRVFYLKALLRDKKPSEYVVSDVENKIRHDLFYITELLLDMKSKLDKSSILTRIINKNKDQELKQSKHDYYKLMIKVEHLIQNEIYNLVNKEKRIKLESEEFREQLPEYSHITECQIYDKIDKKCPNQQDEDYFESALDKICINIFEDKYINNTEEERYNKEKESAKENKSYNVENEKQISNETENISKIKYYNNMKEEVEKDHTSDKEEETNYSYKYQYKYDKNNNPQKEENINIKKEEEKETFINSSNNYNSKEEEFYESKMEEFNEKAFLQEQDIDFIRENSEEKEIDDFYFKEEELNISENNKYNKKVIFEEKEMPFADEYEGEEEVDDLVNWSINVKPHLESLKKQVVQEVNEYFSEQQKDKQRKKDEENAKYKETEKPDDKTLKNDEEFNIQPLDYETYKSNDKLIKRIKERLTEQIKNKLDNTKIEYVNTCEDVEDKKHNQNIKKLKNLIQLNLSEGNEEQL